MSDLNITDDQRAHAMKVISETFNLAALRSNIGRSSMPINIDDAVVLAALALNALDHTTHPAHDERDSDD